MNRLNPITWLAIVIIFILPTTAGRALVDLAGWVLILLLTLPIMFAGLGWIVWKSIKSKMKTCNNCGLSTLSNLSNCPVCGSEFESNNIKNSITIPASSATVDVEAQETE